ncbi:hypothetical protein JMJ35_000201 [Cladonia borealis]|uniref:Uncharacterized protein n=1 Tax=Cladonia borealis TaxID=184061 RepID=A0AA39UEY6_9LECA|nr:hypothetical protein JMJ35_000201 [Cladonia borealis]
MAPKSKAVPLWNPYETFDVFPNTGSFQCLDSRCLDLVDGEDTKAACARLDKMALKDPSEIGEKSLARLAVLCFCSRHREDPRHEGEILGKVSEWQERIEDVLEESDKESEGEMEEEQEYESSKESEEEMEEEQVYESSKESEGEMEEEQVYESGKESEGEMEETQEGEREVIQLLDEVIELKEQLQRTVDENGMLQQQIAADEQRSRKKQTKMSKKITRLQRQVSEVEEAKDDVELAKTVHAREKERLETELERIQEIAACSREVEIKEVNELKVQLQDSGAQVEEAAGHIEDLKGQLEESITRIESLKRATSEDVREFKSQLDRERELTIELTELTSQLKESNTRLEESNTRLKEDNTCLDESNTHLEEINTSLRESNTKLGESNTYFEEESNRLKEINTNLGKSNTLLEERNTYLENSNTRLEESNTRLEESKSHHEVMERQTIAEIEKLRDQLDKSNTSLGDVRQRSIKEASELRDQLTRCENIIAELKAAESANKGQCEANKSNNVLEVCQTENACGIAGSQQSTDSDDAVEAPMAASSLEENQSTEGDHGLKENLCDGKAASTMPTFVLHTEFHNLRMWRQFSLCGSYVDILFNQRKVEQVGIANPALLDEVLRLRKQARDVDRRLASQIVGLSLVSC